MTPFSSVHDDVAKYTQSVNKRKLNNLYIYRHVHVYMYIQSPCQTERGGGVETPFKEVNFPTISIRI